jgi:flagellar basal-body rod protein FlgC
VVDFIKTMSVAAAGLKAQAGRVRIIAENIANANSTGDKPGADPYRRKIPVFTKRFDRELDASMVAMGRVKPDQTPFKTRLEPGHPAADAQGMVKVPNVDSLIENVDMREAMRSYESNLNMIAMTRSMIQRTIRIISG